MDGPSQPLKQLLGDHDAPCPSCGYNLRGCEESNCPECGKGFDFDSLVNRQPRVTWAWRLMVVSYAALLPWSVLYVWQRALARSTISFYGKSRWDGTKVDFPEATFHNPWYVFSNGFWVSVPFVVVAMLLCYRRITSLKLRYQWMLALVCVGLMLAGYRRWSYWYAAINDQQSWEFWWLW